MLDTSGSMNGKKIEHFNRQISDVIALMGTKAYGGKTVMVSVLDFSTDAKWQYHPPVISGNYQWISLEALGLTSMGYALRMLNERLKVDTRNVRNIPIIIFLVSDDAPTDDFSGGMSLLCQDCSIYESFHRFSIGLEDADDIVMNQFVSNPNFYKKLHETDVDLLGNYILEYFKKSVC